MKDNYHNDIMTNSWTGVTNILAGARAGRGIGNYREARMLYKKTFTILLRNRCEPPFPSLLDVANTHVYIAKMQREIVEYSLLDNSIKASYRGDSATHLLKAMICLKRTMN